MATGPATPKGKSRVASNAVKHGLRASKWMSADETADYNYISAALEEEHQPQTATERLTIERIAMAMTKLRRLQRVEDAMYEKARWDVDNPFLPSGRKPPMAKEAALPPIKVLDTLNRYQTTLERQISKSIGELLVLKDRRLDVPLMSNPEQGASVAQPATEKLGL